MIFSKEYMLYSSFECLNSCITSYLNYCQFCLSDSKLFVLGSGYEFVYNNNFIGTDPHKNCFRALSKVEIEFDKGKVLLKENELFLDNMIRNEKLISLKVDSKVISAYSNFGSERSTTHFINIIGISKNKQAYYITDGYIPKLQPICFQGWVDKGLILDAWNKKNNEYICLKKETIKVQEKNMYMIEYKKNLIKVLEKFYTAKIDISVFEHFLFYKIEERGLSKRLFELNFQLRAYGFISYRNFINKALREVYIEEELIYEFDYIREKWDDISILIIKQSLRISGDIDKVINEIKNNLDREKRCIGRILNSL